MRWIVLLKGVNVGGHRRLPMAELRAALEEDGYTQVVTLLASGNVVLDAAARLGAAALEKRLEALLQRRFGLHTDVMVRSGDAWAGVLAANPFAEDAARDPSHTMVMALKSVPDPAAVRATLGAHHGPEKVHVHGREVYVAYGPRMADSKLRLEGLGVSATARNWNTAVKLLEAVKDG